MNTACLATIVDEVVTVLATGESNDPKATAGPTGVNQPAVM